MRGGLSASQGALVSLGRHLGASSVGLACSCPRLNAPFCIHAFLKAAPLAEKQLPSLLGEKEIHSSYLESLCNSRGCMTKLPLSPVLPCAQRSPPGPVQEPPIVGMTVARMPGCWRRAAEGLQPGWACGTHADLETVCGRGHLTPESQRMRWGWVSCGWHSTAATGLLQAGLQHPLGVWQGWGGGEKEVKQQQPLRQPPPHSSRPAVAISFLNLAMRSQPSSLEMSQGQNNAAQCFGEGRGTTFPNSTEPVARNHSENG